MLKREGYQDGAIMKEALNAFAMRDALDCVFTASSAAFADMCSGLVAEVE